MDFIWSALKHSKNVETWKTQTWCMGTCLMFAWFIPGSKRKWKKAEHWGSVSNCVVFPADSVGTPPALFSISFKEGGSAAFHLSSHMCCFRVMSFISTSSGQGNIRQVILNLIFYGCSIITQVKKSDLKFSYFWWASLSVDTRINSNPGAVCILTASLHCAQIAINCAVNYDS